MVCGEGPIEARRLGAEIDAKMLVAAAFGRGFARRLTRMNNTSQKPNKAMQLSVVEAMNYLSCL